MISFRERNVSRFGWKGRGECGTAALGWAARWHGRAQADGVDLLRLLCELWIFLALSTGLYGGKGKQIIFLVTRGHLGGLSADK